MNERAEGRVSAAVPDGAPAAASQGRFAFLLILLSLVVEGFDLQAANVAAPSIVADFNISRAAAGPLLSASLLGILVGAIFVGPLGDRYGRKPIIIWATLAYGLVSLIAAMATSLNQLAILRFIIGIGLGGMMPNALALAGETAPEGRRSGAMAMVGIGITLGGVVAGAVAARLMPEHGWRAVFLVGGILPIAMAFILMLFLPAGRGAQPQAAGGGLLPDPRPLLAGQLKRPTPVIWLVFGIILLTVHLLSSWIPLVAKGEGIDLSTTAWLVTGYHAGGVLGGIVASKTVPHAGWRAVTLFASLAIVSLLATAFGPGGIVPLFILIALAGFAVTGTQNTVNGATGGSYPAVMRSAGLGWAIGVGRIGSILGPLMGSVAALLGMADARSFFILPVIPLAAAALLALWLHRRIAMNEND